MHASGHACGTDLLGIVRSIQPKTVIPVHSESPEVYIKSLDGSKIVVILQETNGSIDV